MSLETDNKIIAAIADRAVKLYERVGHKRMREAIMLELRVCHEMVVPLRLQDLLDADDMNFSHDIGGIAANLRLGVDAKGSKARLENCFLPRFADIHTKH